MFKSLGLICSLLGSWDLVMTTAPGFFLSYYMLLLLITLATPCSPVLNSEEHRSLRTDVFVLETSSSCGLFMWTSL
jgi:hypothetical protein